MIDVRTPGDLAAHLSAVHTATGIRDVAADELDVPPDGQLALAAGLASQVSGLTEGYIALFRGDGRSIVLGTGDAGTSDVRVLTDGLSPRAMTISHRFSSTDLSQDVRFADHPMVDGTTASFRRYAAAAIVVDGIVVGSVAALDVRPGEVSPRALDHLAALADLVSGLVCARRDQRVAAALAAELNRTTTDLQRAQALREALLDALPVAVVACDADGRTTTANRVSRSWRGAAPFVDAGPGPAQVVAGLYGTCQAG